MLGKVEGVGRMDTGKLGVVAITTQTGAEAAQLMTLSAAETRSARQVDVRD